MGLFNKGKKVQEEIKPVKTKEKPVFEAPKVSVKIENKVAKTEVNSQSLTCSRCKGNNMNFLRHNSRGDEYKCADCGANLSQWA